ncbi:MULTISPECIES: tetratricopeptide repeat protein [Treponema]|uniref:Restriction endonuclease n=1 Tax=Treponema rectale TaxID=744512 RepID=A0A840SFA3_9SPIR|nr:MULTISPECIES: tetratricopeptide repeat protein [Treponema]MBB5218121.1 tetratricopeptide (TPR) repeat protein [Treponema rectale]MBE6354615.1 tetratricopeptide repeat protein [Treponema sp.]MBO6177486.1 tetratricopeptide repeat protein [Treponema sp.]QOS40169.1 restriction endonuclease [Treponema rectale]
MLYAALIGILIAIIITIAVFVVKTFSSPQKVDSLGKLIREGKIQQAQRTAKSVLAKEPRNYVAHYWLGVAYMADNKPELAYIEFKTVDENAIFNGDIPEVEFRKQIGALHQKYNQTEDALRQYLLLTKLDPSNAEHDYNVGKLYESQGKAPMAMGFYQKALTVDKRMGKAHTAMGYLLFRSKQYNEAKKEIETAIKFSPENYSNYYYLGKIFKECKELPAAVKAFEKAQRDPSYRQKALIEKGSCLMIANQVDQAQADFEHAVQLSKNDSSNESLYARYFLAACYEKNRLIDKALEQWNIIFKKNRQFRDVSAKLSQYKDLQTNDGVKEFLTASRADFIELCKKITREGLKLECQKIEPTRYGCAVLATEAKSDSWMNVRQQLTLVEYHRETEPIEEAVVRKTVDMIKAQGHAKGIICSTSQFSAAAVKFAENRPLVLVPKEQFEKVLAKIGL